MPKKIVNSGIPRTFSGHPGMRGLVYETDVRVSPRSRLLVKVLVFEDERSLRASWRGMTAHGMNFSPLSPEKRHSVYGVVNSLSCDVIDFDRDGWETRRTEYDKRYLCLMGLVRGELSMEVLCHESTHVGFMYAARVKRERPGSRRNDTELVCYPSGYVAGAINRRFHRDGVYAL